MLPFSDHLAASEILAIRFGIGNLQEIGWYGPAVVFTESASDVMAGWAHLGFVKGCGVFEEFFHPVAVRRENPGDIGFRPFRLAKPPDRVYGVLDAQLTFIYPFDRAWELGWVEPIKVFGQKKSEIVAKAQEYAKIVEAPYRDTFFIGPPQVEYKTAVVL